MNLEIMMDKTRGQMPVSRWEHTLRVRDTAVAMARREGEDPARAEIAAILHDYCKFWPEDELRRRIRVHNLPEDLLDYNPELWHGPVAAEVVREEFGIADVDILNAIRYHTSGRPGMSRLEKIIWLSDVIEPGRRHPGVDEVRKLAEHDLDRAVLKAMDNTIRFLLDRSWKVYPLTLLARNAMLDEVQAKAPREESV
ncbi:bis(5'-nucleosyl)-tetraphosphatase (symmetrical) YqeK [Staphylospora marina]|uniref:bis(5'-nucleosyl)-tetraphosphatase (symmetrical) YqeK n=1 Tax=Staphylospora marina TaxID=2490858 RepID=UPI000F5C23E3|nr:bis(5'-nucleosyl)-tetraphosphatase (symmetrical) YqeK [Staphylospora marina]